MFLCMDQCSDCLCMPYSDYILYSMYILDDIQCMDRRNNLLHMYKLHYHKVRLVHTAMGRMDYMVLVMAVR